METDFEIPRYEMRMEIVDKNTGEKISGATANMMFNGKTLVSARAEEELYSLLSNFEKKYAKR